MGPDPKWAQMGPTWTQMDPKWTQWAQDPGQTRAQMGPMGPGPGPDPGPGPNGPMGPGPGPPFSHIFMTTKKMRDARTSRFQAVARRDLRSEAQW